MICCCLIYDSIMHDCDAKRTQKRGELAEEKIHCLSVSVVQLREFSVSLHLQELYQLRTFFMKFVALLSGGKDSVFSIEKCLDNAHELICVANLFPPVDPDRKGDEINSYMYQSAAFSAIPMQAECLQVPLVRREILGQAKLQTLNYEATENDETEDLFELLRDVKTRFPDVKGVSCGTIISSYQRFRVENTCQRLGLTPLSYLWQRDRGDLLREMLTGGLVAVLVKTAGAGLVPDKHLGKTLNVLYPTLQRLHQRFELDLCGEGGEYESLVLDSRVFHKTLVLTETVIDYDDEDDSVGCLRVLSCETREKSNTEKAVESEGSGPTRSDGGAHTSVGGARPLSLSLPLLPPPGVLVPLVHMPHLTICGDGSLCQTGLLLPPLTAAASSSSFSSCTPSGSPGEQLQSILQGFHRALESSGADIKDTVFVHLYVADLSRFEEINAQYGQWFGSNPPSRSCIQCCLPTGVHVAVECLVLLGSHDARFLGVKTSKKEVLHVRSVSSWAPVCIGPYAQANVLHDSVIFVAGQIALQPSTMTMLDACSSDLVPWHDSLIATLLSGLVEQGARTAATWCGREERLLSTLLPELFLSLFHVNSILSALAGNTPSLPLSPAATLSLVIYVDVFACSNKYLSLLTNEERAACDDSHGIIMEGVHALFGIIKLCASHYIKHFIASVTDYKKKAESRNDGHVESESESESETESELGSAGEQESGREQAEERIPVLVLGVRGLPRGALVEVEFVGITTTLQAQRRLSCNPTSSSASNSQDQGQEQRQGPGESSLPPCPPLRGNSGTDTVTAPFTATSTAPLGLNTTACCVASEAISYSHLLCSGVFSIGTPPLATHSTKEDYGLTSWELAELAVQHLQEILQIASMDVNCLCVFRVYISEQHQGLMLDIKTTLVRAAGKIMGYFLLDPIVIPATHLEANHLLAVQFLCVDLSQMTRIEY